MGKKNARQRMTRAEREAERATERALLARDAARHPEDAPNQRTHGANRRIVEDLEHRYHRLTAEDVMVMTKRADEDTGLPRVLRARATRLAGGTPYASALDESVRLQRYIAQQDGGSAYARAKRRLREERPDLWQPLALARYHTLDRDPTIEEVAAQLGVSPRTAKDRIARATRLLRVLCEDHVGPASDGGWPSMGVEGDADALEDDADVA